MSKFKKIAAVFFIALLVALIGGRYDGYLGFLGYCVLIYLMLYVIFSIEIF